MLSSQARSGIKTARSVSLSQASMQHMRCHFWPFNRRSHDWSSHLDPHFHRFHRQRSIATRAKLIKSIRRLRKWDLGEHASFFTPKHIRLASHVPRYKQRWIKETGQEDGKLDEENKRSQGESDLFELTDREKVWKEQMERFRRHVEHDPYEAVFGRRLEPFWSGLFPNWSADVKTAAEERAKHSTAKKPTSYAYSSSTSWDSWTNRAKKTEWDSVTGDTKHYEYDPISNRMVEIKVPQQTDPATKQVTNDSSQNKQDSDQIVVQTKSSAKSDEKQALRTEAVGTITAEGIRAKMGKPERATAKDSSSQDQHQIEALLQESEPKKSATSRWDHAEQYYRLEQELEQLKAQKLRLADEERRTFHFGDLARRHEKVEQRIKTAMQKLRNMNAEQIQMIKNDASAAPSTKTAPTPLQPALARMQSRSTFTAPDFDDSAAHESTEAVSSVPKAWSQQADMLQADRVQRTTSKVPYPEFPPKWVNDLADREEARLNDKEAAAQMAYLNKTNNLLQAEVDRQKLAMAQQEEMRSKSTQADQAPKSDNNQLTLHNKLFDLQSAEMKHKAKIASLKQELELAYKQSSVHADEFRDQVKKAEERTAMAVASEGKWKSKFAAMKENLDEAYKQSSRHADEFKDQLKKSENLAQQLASKANSKSMDRQSLDERFARYKAVGRVTDEVTQKTVTSGEDTKPDFNEVEHAYKFKPDDLEAELTAASSTNVCRFRKDDLATNVKMTQPTPARQQPAASPRRLSSEISDVAKLFDEVRNGRRVNPIDGTTSIVAGNYASPTGFVNYDQFPREKVKPVDEPLDHESEFDQNPRIKREEQVFTGTKRVRSGRDDRREYRHGYRRRRSRMNRVIKFVTIGGAIAVTTAYVQGMHLENEQIKQQGSREAWQKIASEYERAGERGVVKAMQDLSVNQKTSSGLFWK